MNNLEMTFCEWIRFFKSRLQYQGFKTTVDHENKTVYLKYLN